MNGFGELVDKLGPTGAACVATTLWLAGVIWYSVHRINEQKAVRWPTWVLCIALLCAALLFGRLWLAQRTPQQPNAVTPAGNPTISAIASEKQNKKPPPARSTPGSNRPKQLARKVAPPIEADPRPDYTCGPPFHLAWGRTTDGAFDENAPGARIPKECWAPMTENGYSKAFPTKTAALAAAAEANRCAAPHNLIWEADFDKC